MMSEMLASCKTGSGCLQSMAVRVVGGESNVMEEEFDNRYCVENIKISEVWKVNWFY